VRAYHTPDLDKRMARGSSERICACDYVTGNDKPAVRKAALQSGCIAYLTKPFSAKSLIELKNAGTGPV
jgi:CheY-like chemotaxis protein